MKSLYLVILILTVSCPAIFAGHKNLRLYRFWLPMLKAILIPSALFWIWDSAATARGHWGFNADYILGIYIFNLPVEEYLFFLVIGFVSIFTYEVVKSAVKKKP